MRKALAGQRSLIDQPLSRLDRSWKQLGTTFQAALWAISMTLGLIFSANAQVQRSFINLGFELPVLNPDAADCPTAPWAFSTVLPEKDVPGWRTTHPPQTGWCTNNGGTTGFVSHAGTAPLIDIWKSEKVVGIPSRDGKQHAELNALAPSRIYQTVCLLTGEDINWRFSHRARGDVFGAGPGRDVMEFNAKTESMTPVYTITRANSGTDGTGTLIGCETLAQTACLAQPYTVPGGESPTARHWVDYSSSFKWNAPNGNYQIGFEAISSSNLGLHEGNLIDSIQLDGLKPFVELSSNAYSSQEGDIDDLAISFSGLVADTPLTVQVEVTPITATAGVDYTAPQIINIAIPPDPNGYMGEKFSFSDQVQILTDTLEEPEETFKLSILPSNSYLIQNTRICGVGDEFAEAIYTILDPHMSITKTGTHVDVNGNGKKDAGDRIEYSLTVTNTGSVPLTSFQINDPLLGGNLIMTPIPLAVGASNVTTGIYDIKPEDMLTGKVSNTATVTATLDIGEIQSKTASHELTLDVEPGLDFVKASNTPFYIDANNNGQIDAGEKVPFNFTITNIGNVDATITAVTDDLAGFQFENLTLPSTLTAIPPGQKLTFSGYHLVTQAEIDTGGIINGAEATYSAVGQTLKVRSHAPAGGPETKITIPEPNSNSILTMTKEVIETAFGPDGVADMGDKIKYKITIFNNSSLTLKNLVLLDPKLSLNKSLPILGPWQTHAVEPAPYTLSQADINAGMVDNTASATGETPRGTKLSASANSRHPLDANPSVDFLKKASFVNLVGSELPEKGDRVDYTFTVTNTGNVTIATYEISDPGVLVEKTREPPELLPGKSDSITYKASKIITQADVDAGRLKNTATFEGRTTQNTPVIATSHEPDGQVTVIHFAQEPGIDLQLTGTWLDKNGNGIADAGETIDYRAVVTNSGNVLLTDIQLLGILPTAGLPANAHSIKLAISQTLAPLPPGSSHIVQFDYELKQADIEQGILGAQLLVSGQGPETLPPDKRLSQTVSDDPTGADGQPDRPTLVNLPQLVRLNVEKTGGFLGTGLAEAGTEIEYIVSIINTGNITITDVAPVDAGPTFSGFPGSGHLSSFTPEKIDLAPDDPPASFKAVYTMSAGDAAQSMGIVGSVKNISQATGKTRSGAIPEVIPGEITLTPPAVTITKQADISEALRGSQVPYTITLEAYSLAEPVPVRLVDMVPSGFVYVNGTAMINGIAREPDIEDQSLLFDEILVTPGEKTDIHLALTAGSSVKPGTHINRAMLFYPNSNIPITREALAPVEIITESYFDCGDIIGSVFNDINRNGYQDADESGLPGARIATTQGMLFTTDQHGRFSVACADLPDSRIGTTYIMKLDPRSMPSGYRIISENPRTIRLTPGKVTRLNFAVSSARVVRIDLTDAAFVPDQLSLRPEWQPKLQQLIKTLEAEQSTLRISYIHIGSGYKLANRRVNQLRKSIDTLWHKASNHYRLEIETSVLAKAN